MSVDKLFKGVTRTILAPMAGYTDYAFRSICRPYGVGLTVTEMVSSKALTMDNDLSKKMLYRESNDTPSFCQIFGHEPIVMADSVQLDEVKAYDGVDINMGCPVKKIVKSGDGSALLENPKLASQCITAVKQAIGDKPLSVKFRLGVSDSNGAVDFAKMCRDSGADFITVHFRTRTQMYSGTADYTLLPEIAKVGIPVFANGDLTAREDYRRLLDMGAYGVAVGRGAVGKPYIFAELAGLPYEMDLYEVISRHTELLLKTFSDRVVCNEMKKHVTAYLKGKRNAKPVAIAVNTSHTTQEIMNLVAKFVLENPQFRKIQG
ncbi:MAG: tRNA-dihydrouridine synthase family protein [Clostridiales bacterium]|nr:tRNA-dihydrouridine synthase family protein [Clostridiales bacterium]